MVADELPPGPFSRVTADPVGVHKVPTPPLAQLAAVPTPAKTSVMKNSIVGVAGLLPPPTAAPPVKIKNGTPLPGSRVPTGSVPWLRFVSNPLPVYAERSPVPEAGEFHAPGAAAQGPGAAQKFRNVGPIVNVPPN
jgi:hypothetical protein